jgi:CrcB protein
LVCVFLGAGCGALLRWWFAQKLANSWTLMPLGTLVANLLGGFLAGMALAYLEARPHTAELLRLFFVPGFLGGLTTFSTFSAEVLQAWTTGRPGHAALTIALHLAGSLVMAGLGLLLGQRMVQ